MVRDRRVIARDWAPSADDWEALGGDGPHRPPILWYQASPQYDDRWERRYRSRDINNTLGGGLSALQAKNNADLSSKSVEDLAALILANEITIENVPEDLRSAVQAMVNDAATMNDEGDPGLTEEEILAKARIDSGPGTDAEKKSLFSRALAWLRGRRPLGESGGIGNLIEWLLTTGRGDVTGTPTDGTPTDDVTGTPTDGTPPSDVTGTPPGGPPTGGPPTGEPPTGDVTEPPTGEEKPGDPKPGDPKPDANGNCPPGWEGRDTNNDGVNDICIKSGTGILDLLKLFGGMTGGRSRGETNLDNASSKASMQVFNDPTNFMRFAPSPLQMIDPRYYNTTSFVPEGEQKDFNMGYRGVPSQMYANYEGTGPRGVAGLRGNITPKTQVAQVAQGGLMGLAYGGSPSYPRMNGQIAGPGTEKSDDIPAMLSDGEFVVNAAGVRGIGNLMGRKKPKSKAAQRREGARMMYALQKAGEKAARIG